MYMEKFYYFGYASNLDASTLEGRLKSSAKKIAVAILPHFGFRFNVENPDGSARANVVPSPNESVYGVIYEVDEVDKDYFLTSEPGYDFVEQEVFTKKGAIKAFMFKSVNIKDNIFPKEEYWKGIVKGGKEAKIPNTYLSHIINRAGRL
jgi:hypothetical protein